MHSWRDVEDMVSTLRTMSLDEIAGKMLDHEDEIARLNTEIDQFRSDLEERDAEIDELRSQL